MAMTDANDSEAQKELRRLDILLRRKQIFWETPRGLLLVVATTAAVAGILGFKIGQNPPPPQPIIIQMPTKVAP